MHRGEDDSTYYDKPHVSQLACAVIGTACHGQRSPIIDAECKCDDQIPHDEMFVSSSEIVVHVRETEENDSLLPGAKEEIVQYEYSRESHQCHPPHLIRCQDT